MRINEYNNLEEFIYEYEKGRAPSTEHSKRRYMGIEFKYNGEYYRMCREPVKEDDEDAVWLDDGRLGRYDVMLMHCENTGYPLAESYDLIGWYADIYDVLENCIIQGKKFKEVIMDDSTEILGQD